MSGLALVDLRMAVKVDLKLFLESKSLKQKPPARDLPTCLTSLAGSDPKYFHKASSSSRNLRSHFCNPVLSRGLRPC